MGEVKYMCVQDSASALDYLMSAETGTICTLLPTVFQWTCLLVSKWLFVPKLNECFIIN